MTTATSVARSSSPSARDRVRRATDGTALRRVERLGFGVLVLALGARGSLPRGEQLVLGLCLLTAPLWAPALVSSRWGKVITATIAAAWVSGIALSFASSTDHNVLSSSRIEGAQVVLLLLAAIGVIAHAARLMSVRAVGLCLGVGMLADGIHNPGTLGAENPLKFAVLVPIAVIVFSLVYGAAALVQLTVLLALAVVGVTADARAFFGTALVAAVIVVWQMVRARRPQRSWALTGLFLAGLVLATYSLATSLLISGYLGSDAQERSVTQVQTSGSVLLGGRPELSATIALIGDDVTGFGFGVVANNGDIAVAKAGMAGINYNPNNGYVDRFMFGSAVELHSVVGDLWAASGVPGLVLVAALVVFAFVHVARLVATRRHDVLLVFFAVWTLWNLLFSPLASAVTVLLFTVGLFLALEGGLTAAVRPDASPSRRARRGVVRPRSGKLLGV